MNLLRTSFAFLETNYLELLQGIFCSTKLGVPNLQQQTCSTKLQKCTPLSKFAVELVTIISPVRGKRVYLKGFEDTLLGVCVGLFLQ